MLQEFTGKECRMADRKKISDAFLSQLDSAECNKTVCSGKQTEEKRGDLDKECNEKSLKQTNKSREKHGFDQKLDRKRLDKKDRSVQNSRVERKGKTHLHSVREKSELHSGNDDELSHTSFQGNKNTCKQDLVGSLSQNQLPHSSKEGPKGSGRFPVKIDKTHNKAMGYKFLESLLDKEPRFVVTKLACPKSGFHELINNRPLRPDLLILIVSALSIVNESEFHQIKIQIFSDTFKAEFIDEVKKYVGSVCIEDNLKRLQSLETFYGNILALFETIINLFPSLMNEQFKSTLVALSLSMKNAKSEQKIKVRDHLFEQLQSITEQVNSYIENSKTQELKVKQSSSTAKEFQAPNNFRNLPIIPTMDDFIHPRTFLKHNIVKGSYMNSEHYLDTQFRLLREDFVSPLRVGIYEYIESLNSPNLKRKYSNVRIYPKVQFIEPRKMRDVFGFLVKFDCDSKLPQKMNWEYSKRFMVGSLLLFSDNQFQTFYLATVANRETRDLENGVVFVSFVLGTNTPANLFELGAFFVMAESEVYYEAYKHVLTALKMLNENNFPMKQYIVDVDTNPSPPNYVLNTGKLVYELSTFKVSLLDEDKWPTPEELELNSSQHQAFKTALTNKFVVIQGPPGTGKTFLALKITEVFLKNKVSNTPIVVICYTNHALDQFLEGILKYTQNLVRIGSQSKNESLELFNLNEIRKTKRAERTVYSSPLYRKTIREKIEIQESLDCLSLSIEELSGFKGILDLNVLTSVITPHQLDSLKDQEVDWLTFKDIPDLVSKASEMISDETPVSSQVPESRQSDVYENMNEYYDYEEQIDDDENAQRLADMVDDDYLIDDLDFITKRHSIRPVVYKVYINDILTEINTLTDAIIHCDLPHPQNLYFEQETDFTINELNLLLDCLTARFSKFKSFKFDRNKFEFLQSFTNVWEIHPNDRWELYIMWINLYCCQLKQAIQHLSIR